MWFILLGIALVVIVTGGIYFRRRMLGALRFFGVSERSIRWVGWGSLWLLFGFPILVFGTVIVSIAIGRESISLSYGSVGTWLLVYPFWISVLTMLQAVPYLLVFDLAYLASRRRLGSRAQRYRAVACLVVTAVFVIYTPARIALDRGDIEVRRYDVGQNRGVAPLRIVFLADLQQDQHTDEARARQVVGLANGERPDLTLVGGDWIATGPDFIEKAAETGGILRSRLGVFSVRGDHEHFAYQDQDRSVREVSDALGGQGVEVIDNEVRWLEHEGRRVAIVYLSYNYIYRTPPDEIRRLLTAVESADFSILVTHQFDSGLVELVTDRVDLVLAAHTHGGQVNPVVGVVHVPLARVETEHISGRYAIGATTVIVTAGIGFSIAPFRYASPASIEVIDLYP